MAKLKSSAELSKMRAAGQLTARALQHIEPYVRSGMSTEELNTLAHEFIVSNGATPTPLGYMGYPKSVCTSMEIGAALNDGNSAVMLVTPPKHSLLVTAFLKSENLLPKLPPKA